MDARDNDLSSTMLTAKIYVERELDRILKVMPYVTNPEHLLELKQLHNETLQDLTLIIKMMKKYNHLIPSERKQYDATHISHV